MQASIQRISFIWVTLITASGGCDRAIDGTRLVQKFSTQNEVKCAFTLTYRGNSGGAPCVFPFIYGGVSYTTCTNRDHYTNWCATTSSYDAHKKWGNCNSCSNKRCPTEWTTNGARCAIPFKFNNVWYTGCTIAGHKRPWCAFHTHYQEGAWGDCRESCDTPVSCQEKTEGGTGGGAKCVFPFQFEGLTFHSCTTYKHKYFWCSTTRNFQNLWGNCKGCADPPPKAACGQRNIDFRTLRIVGGAEAKPYSWPWQVSIRNGITQTSATHKCGGVILHALWVLTAASCVRHQPPNMRYYVFGATNFKQNNPDEKGVEAREVRRIINYPGFAGGGPDFALLLLHAPLNFTDPKISQICLPNSDAVEREECFVTGWGTTRGVLPDNVMKEAKIPVMPSGNCSSPSYYGPQFRTHDFCAGLPEGRKDICAGDAGGPYTCYRQKKYELVGILSNDQGCALATKPGIYGRVHPILPWISKVAGDVTRQYCTVQTAGGLAGGKPCFFPFFFEGVYYTSCTSIKYHTDWCSTTPVFQGEWGHCIGCGAAIIRQTTTTTTTPMPKFNETLPVKDRIRLVGGKTKQQGRVEVSYRGQWGTVCDDFFDKNAAKVACTMLGYSDGDPLGPVYTPDGSGEIMLDNLQCRLSNTVLWDCLNSGWKVHDCKHEEDAGVICYYTSGQGLRLAGGSNSSEGRVEVKRDNQWGGVCDKKWTDDDASVVCSSLGYASGEVKYFGQGTNVTLLANPVCDRSMKSLWQCAHDGWGIKNCTTPGVGVKCYGFQWARKCGYRNPPTLNQYIGDSLQNASARIVGGSEAIRFSWPWQVSLHLNEKHYCGGALLTPSWIVTAAHCFRTNPPLTSWRVIAGQHQKSFWVAEPSRQMRLVSEIKLHPGVLYVNASNIALVKVSVPFDFTKPEVGCIILARKNVTTGQRCYVTGWGTTEGTGRNDILNEVVVPIIDSKICNGSDWYAGRIPQSEFCAGYEAGGKDSCIGDGGGPLVCLQQQQFHLSGISSWGEGCADRKKPGVYTKVYEVSGWIAKEIGRTPCDIDPCLHGGTCLLYPNDNKRRKCQCLVGFTGISCETFAGTACIANPCLNGGTCKDNPVDPVNKRICVCTNAYKGDSCQTAKTACEISSCQNGGTCTNDQKNTTFTRTCVCPNTHKGSNCEISKTVCDASPCLNKGNCTVDPKNSTQRICTCPVTYTGKNCETKSACGTTPCQNGGNCTNDPTTPTTKRTCKCPLQYTGENCQSLTACAKTPCFNAGNCTNDPKNPATNRTCQCMVRYTGVNCESLSACGKMPCQNGGTCTNAPASPATNRTCQCPTAFRGDSCQTAKTACELKICLNGGTCKNDVKSPTTNRTCVCPVTFTGDSCQTTSACGRFPCQNGGICKNNIITPAINRTCECPVKYTGNNCQVLSACGKTPCPNGGICSNDPKNPMFNRTCVCPVTFTGPTCQTLSACGKSPCLNSGNCTNDPKNPTTNRTCTCPKTHKGISCETSKTACEVSPCLNSGTCVNNPTNPMFNRTCACPSTHKGSSCETAKTACEKQPCFNGGNCTNDPKSPATNRTCVCPVTHKGTNCESAKTACEKTPCKNAGTCINDPTTPTTKSRCVCPATHTGTVCETLITACAKNPCANNGSCTNTPGDPANLQRTCQCSVDYTGASCEFPSACKKTPCQNGGTCTNTPTDPKNTRTCNCPTTHSGTNCEVPKTG